MKHQLGSTALDPVISRYLAHRRALGRQYSNQERTLHSMRDFVVRAGESDLNKTLFESWCKTFDSLTSNVRRAVKLPCAISASTGNVPSPGVSYRTSTGLRAGSHMPHQLS